MNLNRLNQIPWGSTHGRDENYLGMCMMYYTLAYTHKAKVCVCLGSDSGLVPAMMKEAQIDAGIEGTVYLVDGNMPEAGWGEPFYFLENGETNPDHPFIKNYDCKVWLNTTTKAWNKMNEMELQIDYVHIDASHSFTDSQLDFALYQKLLAPNGVITMHDCTIHKGVARTIDVLRDSDKWDVMEFCHPQMRQKWKDSYRGDSYDITMDDFAMDESDLPFYEDPAFLKKYWDPFGNGTAIIKRKV